MSGNDRNEAAINSSSLSAMHVADAESVVALISRAMNESEGRWARKTIRYHFNCHDHGIDDGRRYFVHRESRRIVGIVGLHHYPWGPPTNVWLAWFAVEPEMQGKGRGTALLAHAESRARAQGYSRMLIETYEHPDFQRARAFYERRGYARVGGIEGYLPDGSAMVVYGKRLEG